MKGKQDYIQDIAEIRNMMERTSKFLSLSGLAGVMAGIYALLGAFVAYQVFSFNPDKLVYATPYVMGAPLGLTWVILLGFLVLVLAVGTAVILSYQKATKKGEVLWNATAKRLINSMAVPLVSGGVLILVFLAEGLLGLIAPISLIFYGLALYNASKFTFQELKNLGLIEIGLGLLGTYFVEYGLLCWALGFGVFHIIYGIYMHYRYER